MSEFGTKLEDLLRRKPEEWERAPAGGREEPAEEDLLKRKPEEWEHGPAGGREEPAEEDLLKRKLEEWEHAPAGEREEPAEEDLLFPEETEAAPDVSPARAVLTELRPGGVGELLVTDVWLAPEPREETEAGEGEPPDRQREWETRQELRELGLLRERPLLSHDARFEAYWGEAKETKEAAVNAIVDPYTELAAAFADADVEGMADHRRAATEYGKAGKEMLHLGRAYVAIGRQKGACSVLEAAAKAEPLHPEVWYNLGVVRLFGRANAGARKAFEAALDQTPGDFRLQLGLAVACYHVRDYAAAAEHFRRLAGGSGLRATARSMLACCHRMAGSWDDARIELGFLKEAKPGDWVAMAQQCADCVERGEQKMTGRLRVRRRASRMWKALAAVAAGGVWLAYAAAKDLFEKQGQWATLPLFVLALLLARMLRGMSGRELPGEVGNAEQGLPCWQSTSWMRPRKSEF
ncbi:MAG: tetratricopeptide repeat protein [Armatimonadetes bacterium]|nr:tetratricopeptide repeat protein [Armatimonadota bacterium]